MQFDHKDDIGNRSTFTFKEDAKLVGFISYFFILEKYFLIEVRKSIFLINDQKTLNVMTENFELTLALIKKKNRKSAAVSFGSGFDTVYNTT